MLSDQVVAMSGYSAKKAWLYLRRSARWRCPICGISPLFLPVHRVEGLEDWYTTLPGCPRCGYPYEREPGYFMLAIALANFAVIIFCGIGWMLALDSFFTLSQAQRLFFTLVPTLVITFLLIRHAEAFFLAFDHFIDPYDNRPPTDESEASPWDRRPPI
jgi:uncharacterized protein (DUF983 family)